MTVVQDLLKLFNVEKQLRSLRSRLEAAERFLAQQHLHFTDIQQRRSLIDSQAKHIRASAANEEGEAQRLEQRITALREQMNTLKTAKEYNAGLTELNTYKDLKSRHEDAALEGMTKVDALDAQLAELSRQADERGRMLKAAKADLAAREAEIKDRLEELKAQRDALAKTVPADARAILENMLKLRGDDAMAPVQVIDRRAHEYACSGCMMALPVETVSAMMGGKLTRCVSCHCIIYTEEEIPPTRKQVAKT